MKKSSISKFASIVAFVGFVPIVANAENLALENGFYAPVGQCSKWYAISGDSAELISDAMLVYSNGQFSNYGGVCTIDTVSNFGRRNNEEQLAGYADNIIGLDQLNLTMSCSDDSDQTEIRDTSVWIKNSKRFSMGQVMVMNVVDNLSTEYEFCAGIGS